MPQTAHPRDAVYWFHHKPTPLAQLRGDEQADVVVVGGGMMGLMCAQHLIARGQSVCLVEADTCGGGASGRSSGFITPDSELELSDLVRRFGREEAGRLWTFAQGGVAAIREAVVEVAACDFQDQDSLFVASTAGGAKVTREEHAAHQALGYASTLFDREGVTALLGSATFFGAMRAPGTFGIDAYRCCLALRDRLRESGARIFEHSAVRRILANGVETVDGRVRASNVVICVDRFLPFLELARREVYHAQTFLAITEPLEPEQVARLFPQGPLMVWDTDLIYTYFRLTGDRRLLIGGGDLATTYSRSERHRPTEIVARVERYLAQRFPWLRPMFAACWPGLIGVSKDFSPIVGRHPVHRDVHFAGGAAGLPWAAALGRYLAERILEGRDELDATLSVDRRFPIGRHLQALLGTPAAFALSHGLSKYLVK